MRLFALLVLLVLVSSAHAQSNLCGSTATALSPGDANCPYGGFKINVPAISQSASTLYSCNGSPGAPGQNAQRKVYVDQTGMEIQDLVPYGSNEYAHYWDGSVFWQINPVTGQNPGGGLCNLVLYSTSACTGTKYAWFTLSTTLNVAMCDSYSQSNFYRQVASVTPPTTCYYWNGSACTAITCGSTPFAEIVSAGTPPNLSTSYDPPFKLVLVD
jgi:hypothetical protein